MKFGYDTIIVGGGVIGVSIAYFLTKSGQRVAVLEREHSGVRFLGQV